MKLLITTALLLLTSTLTAHAQAPTFHAAEICQLQAEGDTGGIYTLKLLNLKKVNSLAPYYLAIANDHAMKMEYTTEALSFADLKELFVHGEQEYNDLYIKIRTYNKTGNKHVEVMTWPGDNPYSTIYDFAGNVIGESGDGDYAATLPDGTEYDCPY